MEMILLLPYLQDLFARVICNFAYVYANFHNQELLGVAFSLQNA